MLRQALAHQRPRPRKVTDSQRHKCRAAHGALPKEGRQFSGQVRRVQQGRRQRARLAARQVKQFDDLMLFEGKMQVTRRFGCVGCHKEDGQVSNPAQKGMEHLDSDVARLIEIIESEQQRLRSGPPPDPGPDQPEQAARQVCRNRDRCSTRRSQASWWGQCAQVEQVKKSGCHITQHQG